MAAGRGKLPAALRSSPVDTRYAVSEDFGKTWGPVRSFGLIVPARRLPATSLPWASDEGKAWHGPVRVDPVGGAYPSLVELPGGRVYCVYNEEGKGSSIRGVLLRVGTKGVKVEPSSGKRH